VRPARPARDPIAELTHDLRTPLALVAGYAELLERRAEALTPEQLADYVARIAEGAREMDAILGRAGGG
jgi:signal transduction histidine kinase